MIIVFDVDKHLKGTVKVTGCYQIKLETMQKKWPIKKGFTDSNI